MWQHGEVMTQHCRKLIHQPGSSPGRFREEQTLSHPPQTRATGFESMYSGVPDSEEPRGRAVGRECPEGGENGLEG